MEKSQETVKIALSTIVLPRPDIFSTDVGGEAVLLNIATGFYHGLDVTGTAIWRKIGQARSIGQICEELATDFKASETMVRTDTLEFIESLLERDLITLEG